MHQNATLCGNGLNKQILDYFKYFKCILKTQLFCNPNKLVKNVHIY